MLCNNHLCLYTDVQYMLLFLVLVVYSDRFEYSYNIVTRSYFSSQFLWALD